MPEGVTAGGSAAPSPVRIQLALWSGGITLALLVVLGIVLYIAVDRSLSSSGTAELDRPGELDHRTAAGPER